VKKLYTLLSKSIAGHGKVKIKSAKNKLIKENFTNITKFLHDLIFENIFAEYNEEEDFIWISLLYDKENQKIKNGGDIIKLKPYL
jgi:hypothetical protein